MFFLMEESGIGSRMKRVAYRAKDNLATSVVGLNFLSRNFFGVLRGNPLIKLDPGKQIEIFGSELKLCGSVLNHAAIL